MQQRAAAECVVATRNTLAPFQRDLYKLLINSFWASASQLQRFKCETSAACIHFTHSAAINVQYFPPRWRLMLKWLLTFYLRLRRTEFMLWKAIKTRAEDKGLAAGTRASAFIHVEACVCVAAFDMNQASEDWQQPACIRVTVAVMHLTWCLPRSLPSRYN